ncbi:toxin-antitoxin system, antitoxin component, ribbon-helix-helix domain protein [Leptospira interrogans serovar Pomona str. Kennewicki LC82-25]|nr:toxin-antitoxin system, antitoxin component, ribbon-helix-helix domain protein [Leptospira interrogans serovar Pomona str. Kennewicki LC82-25]EKN99362.1 toxin-antitoxin system, antitoxin component, ribbon-helix-helix domain protein [Leptospira interrogans serovar Pomona str. Pomona]EMF31367.1 toxin-antitoxin system, antitoxin component, ribbon-helix-helix domain protein [Leptospira interrogans serovar Pomona str. Fox 32256]EMJ61621.1 toxin-antitoxin system, antitoxin component, ribbon-helix-h
MKKPITIRIDVDTIGYFKKLSDQTGIPYQNLINLYLAECASKHKKIDLSWK